MKELFQLMNTVIKLFIQAFKVLTIGVSVATQYSAYGSNKNLEVILTTEAVVSDPVLCKGYQQFQVINLFLDTLVRKDPSIGIISGISEKWDVSENQLEYIFHLSKEARFHNNDPIQAEDILFSFNRHLENGSPSVIAGYLRNALEKIVIVNPRTIKFILKGAYPPFLELLAMPGFGIINHKSVINNIIGSGPFEFKKNLNNKTCLSKIKNYKFQVTNIEKFCFHIERDIEKTIHQLNTNEITLAMGSPLEVALSSKLKDDLVGSPTFSLVSTHIFLNHSTPYLQKKENRQLIRDIAYEVRESKGTLTKFDNPLDTFLPKGIMPESYYKVPLKKVTPKKNDDIKNTILRIVFPYGIFLESTVLRIVNAYKKAGFKVSYINVKGKDLLAPILEGRFDLLFVPYQGVIADPDGYLDLLDPNSMFAKAKLPTEDLLHELSSIRFMPNRSERLQNYGNIFHAFEENLHIIPFSQNSIPIVYNKNIKLPDLNFSFHLNLRELQLKNE